MIAVKTLASGMLVVGLATLPARGDGMAAAMSVPAPYNLFGGLAANPNLATSATWSPIATPTATAIAIPILPTATTNPFATPTAASTGPVAASTPVAPAQPVYDAYINMTGSNFAEASSLVTGATNPWYTSPTVTQVFGAMPNAQQQAGFTAEVLADVARTYAISGIPFTATTDPNAQAKHTLSVISGGSYAANAQAIGITDVGSNGFDFIDKLAGVATNVDQLAQAVANNVSHELMHAFGVAQHDDTTGTHIDTGTASSALLTNPNATFSTAAQADIIKAMNFQSGLPAGFSGLQTVGSMHVDGDQMLAPAPAPVPEPATVVLWLSALGGLALARSRRASSR